MYGHLRGILGDPGTCKTLFLAYISHESYMGGTGVISNFTLEFPHLLMRFDELADLAGDGKNQLPMACDGCRIQPKTVCEHGYPPILENKIIAISEMGKGADSYDFLQSQPRKLSNLVFQGRKLDAIIWYDAQRYLTITTRIRHLTNYFFLMNPVKADKDYVRKNPHLIGNELEKPIQKLITGEHIIKGIADVTATDEAYNTLRKFRFDGRNHYHIYHTEEMIW
jgi:hypothetical protein